MGYDGLIYSIISSVFIIGLTFYYWIVPSLNSKLLFYPTKVHLDDFHNLHNQYGRNIKRVKFDTHDKTMLTGLLVNTERKPKWTDNIFLYSHGNGAWLGPLIQHTSIKMLSKYGSVFLYDYRGYGASDGEPSEMGLYDDILSAWNFLLKEKNIQPSKIIIFGHSLGSSVSSHLVSTLVKQNKELPKAVILEAPFSTLADIASHVYPPLSSLVVYNFNNLHNIKSMNKSLPIYVLHSKTDETIPYDHALKIKNETGCNMIEISGKHCEPIYNSHVDKLLVSLIK